MTNESIYAQWGRAWAKVSKDIHDHHPNITDEEYNKLVEEYVFPKFKENWQTYTYKPNLPCQL